MKWVPLSSVADIERDMLAPEQIPSGVLYVGLEHMTSDGAFQGVTTVDAGELGSAKFRFSPDHVLYGKLRPYLRKVAQPTFSGICSTEIIPIRAKLGTNVRYLKHFLRWQKTVDWATSRCSGANLPRLSPTALELLDVPVPKNPDDQVRLANLLDRADGVLRMRREALKLLDDLLRATFLEMFGDPIANPKGWGKLSFESLVGDDGSIVDGPFGSSLKPDCYVDEGVLVVRNFNVNDDRYDASAHKFVTEDKFQEIRRSEVHAGDLLITVKGTVGDVCLMPQLDRKAVLSASGTVRVRLSVSASVEPEFLVSQMVQSEFKRYLHTFEAGSIQKYLNLSAIRKVEVILPPPEVQERFVVVKKLIRNAMARQQVMLGEAEALFASLQERAFSGEL